MSKSSYDAVFYNSFAIPLEALSILAFVYDKVHLPGVHINIEGLDRNELINQVKSIREPGIRDLDTLEQCNAMVMALFYSYCPSVFLLSKHERKSFGSLEEGANDLAKEIEELYFGPPKPNFFPTIATGHCVPLPGGKHACIDVPAKWTYPANSLIYSSKEGLPLITIDPTMPIPGLPCEAKSNAQILSTILAMECIKFVLPNIKTIEPWEIEELKDQTKQYFVPFKLRMLKLSKALNAAISSSSTTEEIIKEAKFIFETEISPEMIELKNAISDSGQPWHKKLIDIGKDLPQLVLGFSTLPTNIAIANVLARLGVFFSDIRSEQLSKDEVRKRGGLYYLLKLSRK
jgi:hypothetical protein